MVAKAANNGGKLMRPCKGCTTHAIVSHCAEVACDEEQSQMIIITLKKATEKANPLAADTRRQLELIHRRSHAPCQVPASSETLASAKSAGA